MSTRAGQTPISWAGGAHDRLDDRRLDEDWLAAAWAAPDTRVLVLAGSRFRMNDGEVLWSTPAQVPEGRRVLLGQEREGAPVRFAVLGSPDLAVGPEWVGLREVAAAVPASDAPYVLHAVGIAEWHRLTRFCPRCGQPLEPVSSGHVLRCSGCGRDQFPRIDPAVIMLITDEDDRALLGRQPSWPAHRWSTLAGFFEPGESAEDAVRREVAEETGIRVGEVAYVGSQPWPFPSSLMLAFTGRATTTDIHVDAKEIEAARWYSRAEALAAAESGDLLIPPGISISRTLITGWYGADLPSSWH